MTESDLEKNGQQKSISTGFKHTSASTCRHYPLGHSSDTLHYSNKWITH